jgi:hypothetical protein
LCKFQKGGLDNISSVIEENKGGFSEISGFHRGVVSCSLFWDVTQRRMVVTDVSIQHICPIFKVKAVQEDLEHSQTYRLLQLLRTYPSL